MPLNVSAHFSSCPRFAFSGILLQRPIALSDLSMRCQLLQVERGTRRGVKSGVPQAPQRLLADVFLRRVERRKRNPFAGGMGFRFLFGSLPGAFAELLPASGISGRGPQAVTKNRAPPRLNTLRQPVPRCEPKLCESDPAVSPRTDNFESGQRLMMTDMCESAT